MRQAEFNLVAMPFVAISIIVAVAGCAPSPEPKQTPEAAAQEKAKAEDEVNRLTKFLQLCNAPDNGGIAKFEPAHTEYSGRSSHGVAHYIECKNGLGAFYKGE